MIYNLASDLSLVVITRDKLALARGCTCVQRAGFSFTAIIRILTISEKAVIHDSIWFYSHMNSSPRNINERRRHLRSDFKSRVQLDETVYKSATEALEAYIADFEGGQPGLTSYRRRPSDLLSPAPKFYFMDSLERRIRSPPSKSPAKKVDELLEWVNEAYTKELSSKVTPFGYRTAQERPLNGSGELCILRFTLVDLVALWLVNLINVSIIMKDSFVKPAVDD